MEERQLRLKRQDIRDNLISIDNIILSTLGTLPALFWAFFVFRCHARSRSGSGSTAA